MTIQHTTIFIRVKALVVTFILLTNLYFVQAQTKDLNDIQTWYGASLKIDLPHKWAVSTQYRLRIIDDASYYKGSYIFGQIDKRLNQTFELTSNYRLALVDKGVFHRYALGVDVRKEWRKWSINFRPMVQYQTQTFEGNDEGTDTDAYLRPRLTGKYKVNRRWETYLYVEPFLNLYNHEKISWWQNSIGFKYAVNKRFKVNGYYLWQPDFSHKKYTYYNHIIGIDLEFTIKPRF